MFVHNVIDEDKVTNDEEVSGYTVTILFCRKRARLRTCTSKVIL